MRTKNKVFFALLGPTASGKSRLAISLFQKFNSAIVNCDSQQVYADLSIGTAQPTEEKKILPHYLYGFLGLGEQFSAGAYEIEADKCLQKLQQNAVLPVVVGGSGFYLKTLIYGLDDLPEKNKTLRTELQKRIEQNGLKSLYKELQSIDKDYSDLISENDSVRIIRALEIYKLSGMKLSVLRQQKKKPKYDVVLIGLDVDREKLYERINNRVLTMLQSGWIEETQKVLERDYRDWLYNFPGIGYRYIIQYLEGDVNYENMVELIQRDTRRYAKRQYTWFRKMENVHWFSYNEEKDKKQIEDFINKLML